MPLLFLFFSSAWAEPAAIRAPVGAATLAASWGDGASLVLWHDDLGLALDASGAAVGAALGWRHLHANPVGFDLFGHGGVAVPFIEPGLALTLGASARFGYRNAHFDGGIGLAIPAALGLWGGGSGLALRVPLSVEPAIGVRVGPLWFALSGSMGPLYVTGSIPGIMFGGKFSVGYCPKGCPFGNHS